MSENITFNIQYILLKYRISVISTLFKSKKAKVYFFLKGLLDVLLWSRPLKSWS